MDEFAAEARAGQALQDGKIPGAVLAPRGMAEFYADMSSPQSRREFVPSLRTLVSCASGGRSALAAAMLQELAYRDVAHLAASFGSWRVAGRPIAAD